MKKVYLTIGTTLLIAFLPVLVIAAQTGGAKEGAKGGPGRASEMNPEALMQRMARMDDGTGLGMVLRQKEQLGLSDEQVKKLEALESEVKEQLKAKNEAVRAKRDALDKAVDSGASEAAIRAAAGEIGNAIGDHAVLRAATKTKVNAILTDAQKTKLEELRKERPMPMRERRGTKEPAKEPAAEPKK
jgi:Spy/CpxP family protein refolding chaperone